MHVELKLDKRRINNSGRYPIKVYLSEGRMTRMVATGIDVKEDRFDSIRGEIIGGGNKSVNDKLAMILNRSRIETEGLGLKEAVAKVRNICNFDGSMSETFIQFWNRCVASSNYTKGTIVTYNTSLKAIGSYCDLNELRLESINTKWLRGLQTHLLKRNKINTVALFLSRLKRIINCALDEELISVNPFRSIKIRTEETEKRCLSINELVKLRDMKLNGLMEYARDMFMLSFYLLGMNSSDMYKASPAKDGRLHYRRSKTGKLYDVKVEPEAAALIEKHAGNGFLLSLSERYSSVTPMTIILNKALKKLIPGISMYWARHSWATIAADLNVPVDVISLALGHSFGLKMTSVYIKPNIAKVDAANRLVLDHLRKIGQNGSAAISSGVSVDFPLNSIGLPSSSIQS